MGEKNEARSIVFDWNKEDISSTIGPLSVITNIRNTSAIKRTTATTVLSVLPVIVLEIIFSYIDSFSIDSIYEADPYIENLMDSLISIQNLKKKLCEQEEEDFEKNQFALWRERSQIIYGRHRKKLYYEGNL